jgi:hypothetical protein
MSIYIDYVASNGAVIEELEIIWKESFVAYSRRYTEIFLEGLRKAMKDLVQDIRYPDRDSNPDTNPKCYEYTDLLGLYISDSQ